MSKKCTLFTVIDFEGLANYYEMAAKLPIYDADSFFNIICDDAPFVGPSNQVLLFEQDVNYIWQMNALSNLSPESKYILPVIKRFEFNWIGSLPVNWEGVFDLKGSNFKPEGPKLISTKFKNAQASIKTTSNLFQAVPELRLSYSIQFEFAAGKKTLLGTIDPIIKNRSEDT